MNQGMSGLKKSLTKKRELRVFLSSTFRDMQYERDYLIKKIFPEIRKACRERLVEFTEVDLRWGVTKEEAEQGKVVRICLEEIDRCRPYFLSFLGERYGWSPIDSDIEHKHELIKQFPIVETSLRAKKSVTEMEILHGVLENASMTDHSFFYFRSEALTHELGEKSGNQNDYYESDDAGKAKLLDLKQRIRNSDLPLQDNIATIEELGKHIKHDLLAALDKQYPQDTVPSALEAERLAHEAYAEDRYKAYISNPADIEALNRYIDDQPKGDTPSLPLIISGESGLGKSALLAYWLDQYKKQNPDHFIIQHYAGISGDANAVATLRRIMAEIKERTQESDELPSKPEDVIKDFPLWLTKVRLGDPLLMVLDGINQIEASNQNWLPSFWPQSVRLILSTIPSETLTQLQARRWQTYLVQPLDIERRSQLIQDYLQNYRKALSAKQGQKIASLPQCGNPLFLRTILEELRVFGVHEQLDVRIADYLLAQNPAELFEKVLIRMEQDYGEDTVSGVLSAVWAARRGLSETELMSITGISRLNISTFLLALDYHLARRGGLLNFFHDYLRHAVQIRYLQTDELQRDAHLKLANYFDKLELDIRKADELPWQWQNAYEVEQLIRCISEIPLFMSLYNNDQLNLVKYWRFIKEPRRNQNSLSSSKHELGSLSKLALRNEGADILSDDYRWNSTQPGLIYRNALNKAASKTTFEALKQQSTLIALGDFFSNRYVDFTAAEIFLRRAFYNSLEISDNSENSLITNLVILDAGAITILNKLNALLIKRGSPYGTEHLCRKAWESCWEPCNEVTYTERVSAAHNLAMVLQKEGHHDEATIVYRVALDECSESEATLNDAAMFNNYGEYLHGKGEFNSALRFVEKGYQTRNRILGPEHPDTAISICNLGDLQSDLGNDVAAEANYRQALAILFLAYGDAHPETVDVLVNLGTLLNRDDSLGGWEYLYRALSGWKKFRGLDHPDTPRVLTHLEEIQESDEDYDGWDGSAYEQEIQDQMANDFFSPEQDARSELKDCQDKYGLESEQTAEALEKLAISIPSIVNGHDLLELKELWSNALSIRRKLNCSDLSCLKSIGALAIIESRLGNLSESANHYRTELKIQSEFYGEASIDTIQTMNGLGNTLWNLSEFNESESILRKIIEIRHHHFSSDTEALVKAKKNLAVKLESNGKYREAEELYGSILNLLKGDNTNVSTSIASILNALGNIQWRLGKLEEAEGTFRQGISIEITAKPKKCDSKTTYDLTELLYFKGDISNAENLILGSFECGQLI